MARLKYEVKLVVFASKADFFGENAYARQCEIEDIIQGVVAEIEPIDVDVVSVKEKRG